MCGIGGYIYDVPVEGNMRPSLDPVRVQPPRLRATTHLSNATTDAAVGVTWTFVAPSNVKMPLYVKR